MIALDVFADREVQTIDGLSLISGVSEDKSPNFG